MQIWQIEAFNQGVFLLPLFIAQYVFFKTFEVTAIPNKDIARIYPLFEEFVNKKFIFVGIERPALFGFSIPGYCFCFIEIFLPFLRDTRLRERFLRVIPKT